MRPYIILRVFPPEKYLALFSGLYGNSHDMQNSSYKSSDSTQFLAVLSSDSPQVRYRNRPERHSGCLWYSL